MTPISNIVQRKVTKVIAENKVAPKVQEVLQNLKLSRFEQRKEAD